jgi:hypothetical protein
MSHHHSKQSTITVDVEFILSVAGVLKNPEYTIQVVHCTLHCCTYIDIHNGWASSVPLQFYF